MISGITAASELNWAGSSSARMNWRNLRLLHHFFWESMQLYFTPSTQTSGSFLEFAAELSFAKTQPRAVALLLVGTLPLPIEIYL